MYQRCRRCFGWVLVAMAMSACGGGGSNGGGGQTPPTAPSPPPAQPAPAGTLQLSADNYAAAEGDASASITITRTGGSGGEVSVSIVTSDETAIATQDYSAVSSIVTFADGDVAPQIITVPILDDTIDEPDETVVLILSEPTGGASLGAPTTAVLTIADDDVPPAAPELSLDLGIKQLNFSWPAASGATSYRLLQDPIGSAVFTPVGADLPADAMGTALDIAVHEHDWTHAQYRIEACNEVGCTASNVVDTMDRMLEAIGYVKASNAGSGDKAGYAVALSADGDTLAVGAFEEDSAATGIDADQANEDAPNAGAVYVFARSDTGWSQQAYVKASNAEAFDRFGYALALSGDGNTLAVGAYSESGGASGIDGDQTDNLAAQSGAVYVYVRAGGSWSQQAYVKASNPDPEDLFGLALSLDEDGDTLAVGAYAEDSNTTLIDGNQLDNSASAAGAVYVFYRVVDEWEQQAYVKASNAQANDQFGTAVALSGDGATLAVGAPGEDSNATGVDGDQSDDAAGLAGAVYVFTRDADTWIQHAYVKASNTDGGDQFGFTVALSRSADTLAVGAVGEDSIATGVNGDGEDDSSDYSGAAYVFAQNGGAWSQQAYLKPSVSDPTDQFSLGLALSSTGDVLIVGAVGESSPATGIGGDDADNAMFEAGAAYRFVRTDTTWSFESYIKASNSGVTDNFGACVAISGDGRTLAIGAPNERSGATGLNGDQADDSSSETGAVYLY